MKEVKVGEFCRVMDSSLAEYGVKKNDIVYVAGDTVVHVGREDPYALRRMFVAAWMKGDHVDAERGAFTVDGKRLKPCTKGKQARLKAVFEEDFKEDDSKD